jgi:hypothetical protein
MDRLIALFSIDRSTLMETVLQASVLITQFGLAGFITWGALACIKDALRASRTPSFERVASLVLLALLSTTLAALP